MRSHFGAWNFLAVMIVVSAFPVIAADDVTIAPESAPIKVDGSFGFTSDNADPDKRAKKIEAFRRAASGIACARPGHCLVVFDEGAEARMMLIGSDGRMVADDQPIVLVAGGGEVDAEGATTDGAWFYVIGSHAMKRSSCEENPDSRVLLRAPVDGTGRPAEFETVSLWETMAATELRPYLGRCLGRSGVDIEAIAKSADRLFFGFRGPKKDDRVPVLNVDANRLFEGGAPAPIIDWLSLGGMRGLRDMVSLSDGTMLLLAGPDDDPAHKFAGWALFSWEGSGTDAVYLATLDLSGIERRHLEGCDDDKDPEDRKPEAIYADQEAKRVLLLSDGLCDGGPMWLSLPGREAR